LPHSINEHGLLSGFRGFSAHTIGLEGLRHTGDSLRCLLGLQTYERMNVNLEQCKNVCNTL